MVRDSRNPDLGLWVQALRVFLELDSTSQLHGSGPGLLEVRHFQTGRNSGILILASRECGAKVSLMRQGFEACGWRWRSKAPSLFSGTRVHLTVGPRAPQALGPGPRTWDIFLLAVSPPWSPVGISDFTWSKPDCGSFSPNLSLLETPPQMRPRHPPNGHHLATSRQSAAALVPKLHEPPCSLHPHHYPNPP